MNISFIKNSYRFSLTQVCLFSVLFLFSVNVQGQITYKVGATGGTHTTIAAAYAACSTSTDYIIEIQTNYNIGEVSTAPIVLGAKPATSITIRPQTGNNAFGITTSLAGPIFDLNGATKVTIDGRPGGVGTTGLLSLTNTNTQAAGGCYVALFENGANNNTIQYCKIFGANPNATSGSAGIISIKAYSSGQSTDYNTIDNCSIQSLASLPAVAINSRLDDLGAGSNNFITISNCSFSNFSRKGIWITNPANNGWRIINNSFFQTTAFTPVGDIDMISISNGANYLISGNYLGGQAPNCGGSAYSYSSYMLRGIYFASSIASTSNTIQNNTIQNISYSASNSLTGILLKGSADFICGGGPGLGNTIGSLSTAGSISYTNNSTFGSAGFTAIKDSSTGSQTISFNNIGGIQTYSLSSVNPHVMISNCVGSATIDKNTLGNSTAIINNTGNSVLTLIEDIAPNPVTVSNNTIQGISLSNAGLFGIRSTGLGTFTCTGNNLSGVTSAGNLINCITSAGSGSFTANNNIIQGINLTASVSTSFIGIGTTAAGAGTFTCTGNSISNISSATSNTGINGCIHSIGSGNSIFISQNTISGISFTNTTNVATVNNAILLNVSSANGGTVSKNTITGLSNSSTSVSAKISGIELTNGSWSIQNNVILLDNTSGNTIIPIYGIEITSSAGTSSFYYNTVKISGTQSGTVGSFGIASNSTAGTFTIKNNIFQNIRTGGTGIHYAESYPNGPSITTNYNYLETNTPSTLCRKAGTNYSLSTWQTSAPAPQSVGGTATIDATGKVTSPAFAGAFKGTASLVPAVSDDITGAPRNATTPWIGAYEGAGIMIYPAISTVYCEGALITINYVLNGTFNTGNTFTAQLSNSSGSFASPYTIASVTSTTATSITGNLPAGINGAGYRIRIVSTNTAFTSPDNGADITINPLPNVAAANANICAGASATLSASGANTYSWTPATYLTATNIANPVANPPSTTTYTVTGTNTFTCSKSVNVTVTVTPLPVITSTTPGSICGSGNVTLSAVTSAGTINWYNALTGGTLVGSSNTYTTPLISTTTTYYVEANNLGCISSSRTSVTATVNPKPTVVTNNPAAVCSPSTVDLTSTAVTSGSTAGLSFYYYTDAAATNTLTAPTSVSASGTYYIVGKTAASCTDTTPVTVTINAIPTINAGTDQTICATQNSSSVSATFTNATSVLWTTSGTGIFSPSATIASPTYTLSAADKASPSFTLTATTTGSGACSSVSDNLTIYIAQPPTINAGVDQTICANQNTANLSATSTNATGVIWSTTGTGTFSPSNTSVSPIYTLSAADKAAASITFTATTTGSAPCSAVSDQMVINIKAVPTINAGVDQTFCQSQSTASVSATLTNCPGVVWSTSGTGTFAPGTTSVSPTYSLSAADQASGSITLTATSTGTTPCTAVSDQMVINLTPLPTINAGVDQTICSSQNTASVTATYSFATGVIWTSSGTGTFSPSANVASPTYTLSAADKASASISLTATTTGSGSCSPVSDVMVINIKSLPTINAGVDQTICASQNTANVTAAFTNATGVVWSSSGTGTFTPSTTSSSPTYNLSAADQAGVSLTLTASSTGSAPCAAATDNMIINLKPIPTINAGVDQIVCAGSTASLSATITNATGVVWSTSGTGTFTPSNTSLAPVYTPSAADIASGSLTITATSTGSAPCAGVTDNMIITIKPAPTINAGVDQNICASQNTVSVSATFTNATGVTWTTSGSGTFSPSATSASPTYTLSAADKASASVTLTATTTGTAPCAAVADNMVINIKPLPTINAGVDQTICASQNTASVSAIITNATGVTWTSSGTGTFSPSNTSLSPTYTLSAADKASANITLTATTTGSTPCAAVADNMIINITALPTINAGVDQTICANQNTANVAATYTNATGVTWTSSGTGTFSPSAASSSPTYTLSAADKSSANITLTATTTGSAPCAAVTDNMIINLTPVPTINAGVDQTICANQNTVNVAATYTNATGVTWTSSGTGTFSPSATAAAPTYTLSAADKASANITLTATTTGSAPCAAVTDNMIINITPLPTINAGIDQTICASQNTASVTATFTNATGVTWTSSGTGTFSPSATSASPTYTLSAADKASASITLTATSTGSGTCAAVSDNMIINITPLPAINAGLDQVICGNQNTANISASILNATGVVWNSSGTGTFTPSATTTSPTYTLSAADKASSSITLTATSTGSGACPAVTDNMVINIKPVPTINAGVDQNICATQNTVNVTATFTNATGVSWTSSGTGTFTPSATSASPTYTLSAADKASASITLTATSTGMAPCAAVTDNMVINIKAVPTVNAGIDQTICATQNTASITATITNATGVVWSTSGNGTFTPSNTSLTPTYTLSAADKASASITLTATTSGSAPCAAVTDKMIINITPLTTANAGSDISACTGGGAIALSGSANNASSVQWSTLGSGSFSNTTTLSSSYTPSAADEAGGQTKIILKANSALCANAADTLLITYTTAPVISAGPDGTSCGNSPIALNASGAPGTWSGGAGIFTPNATTANATYQPTTTEINSGSITLTITSFAGLCPVVSDQVQYVFKPVPTVNAVAAINICSGTSTNIGLTSTPAGATFTWTVSTVSGSVTGPVAGSGNTIAQTLNGNGSINYNVIPTLNSCPGTALSIPVTTSTPVISPATLTSGSVGSVYSQTFAVTNMTSPIWSSSGGPLPTGLTLSSGGILNGTPTANNSYSFNITATEGVCTITQPYTIIINNSTTTWDGTSWSNGIPNANTDAIISGDYTTTNTEILTAKNITIGSGTTLTINGTASVNISGGLSNNGVINQKCSSSLTVTGTTTGNAVNLIQPVLNPATLNNGIVNTPYIQSAQFSLSFSNTPTYSVTNFAGLTGLQIAAGSKVISGNPSQGGVFNITVKAQDGNCMVSKTYPLQIDRKSSVIDFHQLPITKTYGDAPFNLIATSNSTAPINYSINPADTACVSVDNTGKVTIKCVPGKDIYVVASLAQTSQFQANKDSILIHINKAVPRVVLLTLPGIIKDSTTLFDFQKPESDSCLTSFFQVDGQQFATVNVPNSSITGIAAGDFSINLALSATQNYYAYDTTFKFTVFDTSQPPLAVPDTVYLIRKDGVISDGSIDLLKNDLGITAYVKIYLTDIDTINPGKQSIFYSPSIGAFEFDPLTGILTIHPAKALSSNAKIGYTITDANGLTSPIAYISIQVVNMQDLPDLKANQVMTPNEDGSNDVLFVGYTDTNKKNSIVIIDEAGNTVYKKQNYQNDWVGVDQHGKPLESGVYYYVFKEEEDMNRTLKGYIEIIRRGEQ